MHEDDWHYADATMNVTVGKDAVFELGSHARLVGDVTVGQNGVYVMREGVRHQMEYVEGGLNLEDTGKYSAYFGHKGDVHLNGGTFSVEFNDGVDSELQYAGSVTGTGNMTVDTGAQGGSFVFSGTVDAGVNKVLNRGILELSGAAAADTTNRWLVNAGGVMVQQTVAADTLTLIDSSSTGTLGLNADTDSMLDMSHHSGLYVGALAGATVQYGNAAETVAPPENLNLGGAGGHLVVNSALTGEFNLNLREGTVTFTHADNNFSALVNAQACSTLLFSDAEAAKNVYLSGGYGVRVNTQSVMMPDFQGTLLVQSGMGNISLADSPMAALGAAEDVTYSGNISLATSGAYRFGGITGTLTVDSQVGGAHALVVDNQGFEGGVLQLNNISDLTGKVTIQGSDAQHEGGSVTLAVTQHHALSQVSAVELKKGATLELYGTSQILHGLNMAQGSYISDSSAERTGRVTIEQNAGASLDLKGSIDADVDITGGRVITHGADALKRRVDGADAAILELQWSGVESLSGGNYTNLSKLQVSSGSVTVTGKLDAATIQVNSGAQYATGSSHNSAFVLSGAGMAGATHQGALSLAGNVTMSGSVTLQSASTINVVSGWSATISGAVDARNYTLTKSGEGTLTISGSLSNSSNIRVEGGKLTLNSYNTEQNLVLTGGGELAVTNWGTRDDAVSIKDGSKLILSDNGNFNSNVSGNGTVHVKAAGQQMWVNGSFSDANNGQLAVEYSGTNYLAIASSSTHTGGTTLNVNGQIWFDSETAFGKGRLTQHNGTIYLLYHNMAVDSLAGNGSISKYSCDSITLSGEVSSADSVAQYTGNLAGGIKLQKNGAYTQEFVLNGDTTLPSVTVNGGTLDFRSDKALNLGSVSVASGSTLALGGSGSRTLGTSSINGVLNLEGMNLANTHLDIAAGATVSFGNDTTLVLGAMEEGKTYTVFDTSAQGASLKRWSADNINIDSTQAHNASFEFLTEGQLKYNGGENYLDLVWNGGTEVNLNTALSWRRDSDKSVQSYLQGDGIIFERNDYTFSVANQLKLAQVHLRAGASLLLDNSNGYTLDIGHISSDSDSMLTVKGAAIFKGEGTTNIAGTVETDAFYVGKRTVNLLEGAMVITSKYISGNTANYQPSIVNIGQGAHLIVTGDTDTDNTDTSFLLAHWKNSNSTLVLNGGEISAQGTSLHMGWDSAGRFEALSGVATLKGIRFTVTDQRDYADVFILGEATINIGSSGITGIESNDTVQLGNGTIAATANFSINGDKAIDMVGTTNGTTFNTAAHTITVNTALTGNGNMNKIGDGTLNLNADTAQYTGDVNINGGTLVLGSNALGILTSGSELVVNQGGTLDLSAATISENLFNPISGTGTVILTYAMNNNGTGFDFSNFSGNVKLDKGRVLLSSSTFGDKAPDFILTSGSSQLVFNGNGTVVNSNVYLHAGTTIHANSGKDGEITGEFSGNYALTKQGAGKLTLSGKVDISTLNTSSGEIILAHTGEAGNTIGMLDASIGSSASGTLRLAQNSHTTVTGTIWARANKTSILLEEGASLTNTQDSVIFTNRGAANKATLRFIGTSNDDEYSIAGAWELTGGHLTYTADADGTLANKLTNSSVENAGSGLLIINNQYNTITELHATGGRIEIMNLESLELKTLEIANSLSVGAYTDNIADAASEAQVTITGTATFGVAATLNADLVMKSGATLNAADTVKMGSDIRLETGLTLEGQQLEAVKVMKEGERVTLFTGIDSLYLGMNEGPSIAFTLNDSVLAKDYFSNLADNYYLVYDTTAGVGEGTLSIEVAPVPEPTTATLSLLALAGLAARRRRK